MTLLWMDVRPGRVIETESSFCPINRLQFVFCGLIGPNYIYSKLYLLQVNEFCKIISEFSLEYRTTRERVIQMKKKKENMRERSKTRGKLITETEVTTDILYMC